jgi:lysophospholipase L1-like esterase
METRTSSEYSYVFKTNAQGLRNRELPLAKPKNEFRAVVVGDSYTEGFGVRDEETFCSFLEQLASTLEFSATFINAGLSGTGPVEYARVLFGVGTKYHPDLAMIVLHANDLDGTPQNVNLDSLDVSRLKTDSVATGLKWQPGSLPAKTVNALCPWTCAQMQNFLQRRERKAIEALPFRQRIEQVALRSGITSDRLESWLVGLSAETLAACESDQLRFSFVAQGLINPEHFTRSLDICDDVAERKWESMRNVLDWTVARCRANDIDVAVFYTPVAEQFDATMGDVSEQIGLRCRRKEWLTEEAEIEKRLKSWALDANVPYLSLTETFRQACGAEPGKFNFPLDGHWNAKGHQLAAKTMYAWLRDRQLLAAPNASL